MAMTIDTCGAHHAIARKSSVEHLQVDTLTISKKVSHQLSLFRWQNLVGTLPGFDQQQARRAFVHAR